MAAVEASWRYGRYVCQLHRLTLHYCRSTGSSRGMRDFLEKHMVDFAEKNPSISIYVNERKGKNPKLIAQYLNGKENIVEAKNMEPSEIHKALKQLRNESGKTWITDKVRKRWHTDKPSIQGTWNPLLNKPATNYSD